MDSWGTVVWVVARAGGWTAYLLLTLSVVVGLALRQRWQSGRWPRLINSEVHNYVTLLATIFVGVHVLAVWIDPFTRFSLNEVLIPFISHYSSLWMGLGIVGLYLAIAVGISTWVRPLIGYTLWQRLHVLTLLTYGLVTLHGIALGTDSRGWWAILLYATSILIVIILLVSRLLTALPSSTRAHPVIVGVVLAALFVTTIWAILGPLQPSWSPSNGTTRPVATAAP